MYLATSGVLFTHPDSCSAFSSVLEHFYEILICQVHALDVERILYKKTLEVIRTVMKFGSSYFVVSKDLNQILPI
jgi:hypothetical protein